MDRPERRRHRRLQLSLPLSCRLSRSSRSWPLESTTRDVSPGGVYFELVTSEPVELADLVQIEMSVGDTQMQLAQGDTVSGTAQIRRIEPLRNPAQDSTEQARRLGIAAEFSKPLKLRI